MCRLHVCLFARVFLWINDRDMLLSNVIQADLENKNLKKFDIEKKNA